MLDQLTALGPFFAAESHAPHAAPRPPWRAMSELLDDPAVLGERVHASRIRLAAANGQDADAVEQRVAASVTHLALAARILSPLLALAVLHGRIKPASLREMHWQPTPQSTFPLSIAGLDDEPGAPVPDADPDSLAPALADAAISSVAADLDTATGRFGVSGQVLRGNIASALSGACSALCSARPHDAPRIQAIFARLLRHPALDGTSQTSLDGRFQRRSCCLIYRAAPNRDGMVCGDCVLLGTRRCP